MLEFFKIKPKLPTQNLPITTLIKDTLKLPEITHPQFTIKCIAVAECAAEKWVALTRRMANIRNGKKSTDDGNLIRHLYDLYCIHQKMPIADSFYQLIPSLIAEDRKRFKTYNLAY